jgi:hypothetical protein
LALSFEFPSKELFLYDFHTRECTPWITDAEIVDCPALTADSQYVECQTAENIPGIRLVKAGNSHPQDLLSLKGIRPFLAGFGGATMRRTIRASSPANATSREIYAFDLGFP